MVKMTDFELKQERSGGASSRCAGWRVRIAFASAIAVAAATARVHAVEASPYATKAREVTDYVQKTFWSPDRGYYFDKAGEGRKPDYIWRQAAAFSMLVGAARHERDGVAGAREMQRKGRAPGSGSDDHEVHAGTKVEKSEGGNQEIRNRSSRRRQMRRPKSDSERT